MNIYLNVIYAAQWVQIPTYTLWIHIHSSDTADVLTQITNGSATYTNIQYNQGNIGISIHGGDRIKFYTNGWNTGGWKYAQRDPVTDKAVNSQPAGSGRTGILTVPSDVSSDATIGIHKGADTTLEWTSHYGNKDFCDGWAKYITSFSTE